MFETILYRVEKQVAWITLNRPHKLNAFTETMNQELTKALTNAAQDEEVRALVITGAGRAFCAGEDLSAVSEDIDHGEHLKQRYHPMVRTLASVEKPIIAAVNGAAAGAGLSLALACDFRLAHEDASFVEAFIHIGLIPDAGNHYYLPRLIGLAKALELAILGEKITAQQAEALHLVTAVYPASSWEEDVAAFAERLAQMPTKTIGLIKRYLYGSFNDSFEESLEKEVDGQTIAGLTADHHEGVAAFLEKRKPIFKGK